MSLSTLNHSQIKVTKLYKTLCFLYHLKHSCWHDRSHDWTLECTFPTNEDSLPPDDDTILNIRTLSSTHESWSNPQTPVISDWPHCVIFSTETWPKTLYCCFFFFHVILVLCGTLTASFWGQLVGLKPQVHYSICDSISWLWKNCMHGRTLICEKVCVCVHAHVRKRERENLRVFTHVVR